MDCERARRAISERMDGERLSPRLTAAVERHVAGCVACAAFEAGAWKLREAARFEVAPAVPDLVDSIMASVQRERQERAPTRLRLLPGGRARRPLLPDRIRLAPVAAALAVGLVVGSLAVGGPWQRPEGLSVDAAEVTRGVAAAATTLSSYQARFAVTEYHFAPDVPVREFSMNVWFQAPERFRLDVVDHTQYPSKDVTPTDLELIVNGSSWYSVGPSACPIDVCPPRQTVVENRVPFSSTTPAPTDLILPVTSLADANQLEVVGRGSLLGRPAIEVRLPFDLAEPLFPFLSLGGSWRPFFGSDQVDLWLDATSWLPLSYAVYPARGRERDEWALRFGLPSESPRQPIFQVVALSVDRQPPGAGTFRIPQTSGGTDQGAKPVSIFQASEETGFRPIEPEDVDGLSMYQVVLPPASTSKGEPSQTLITYSKGLAWLKLGETRDWTSNTLYGPVSLQAQEVSLANGSVAYYEPATADHGRRLSIHAVGTDLYVETNLSRDMLLHVAGSLRVTGIPIPAAWAVRTSPEGVTERVTLAQAAAETPFTIMLPASEALPAGYSVASAEIVRLHQDTALNVYFQQQDTDLGTGPIRLHEEVATKLPPASSAAQSEVEVRGVIGRWTPDRNQLEWVEQGVYLSLDAGGLSLADLLAVAASLEPSAP
ncbi:MAG TPA: zf-HC2 domain-containing protein [Actinomycetota bacterium]|nr:zf-HC2 domain-containing protein [Actinomycetota bacterium]